MKKKVKLKRDDYRVSCFECHPGGKMVIAGSEDGGLQLVANPKIYEQWYENDVNNQ